MIFIITCEE